MPVCNVSSQIVIMAPLLKLTRTWLWNLALRVCRKSSISFFFFTLNSTHPEGAAGGVYGPGTDSGSEPAPCWSKGTDCTSQLWGRQGEESQLSVTVIRNVIGPLFRGRYDRTLMSLSWGLHLLCCCYLTVGESRQPEGLQEHFAQGFSASCMC